MVRERQKNSLKSTHEKDMWCKERNQEENGRGDEKVKLLMIEDIFFSFS